MLTGVSRLVNLRLAMLLTLFLLFVVMTVAAQAAVPSPAKPAQAKSAQTKTAQAKTAQANTAQANTAQAKPAPSAKEQAAPAAPASHREWGPYLDVAYELTYWEKPEIRDWCGKREEETGEKLAAFIAREKAKLAPVANDAGRKGNRPLYPQRDYLRLAIAQTVDFIQSERRESLDGAVKTLEILKNKETMPEVAYWTGFVGALLALENNDSPQFVARIYEIWNNAVIYIAEGEADGAAAGNAVAPFYCRNLVHLVVNRAIIEHKQGELTALGPLFFMLNGRDFGGKDGEGPYFAKLVQRITEGMSAPDSDRFRLNFTVAMIEAKRLQQAAFAKIDAEGMTEQAQKDFEGARLFNDYALKWAASRRSSGVAAAAIDYLDSSSFAIQRLAANEKAPAYKYFAMLPASDGSSVLLNAMAVFNDIATYSEGGWEKAGFASREAYLKVAHRLWRAIMESSLWTGDFYLGRLNVAADQQGIFAAANPMQAALNAYLDFLAAQESRKYADVIPDSAYFGAAEAANKLAYAYSKVQAYGMDSNFYDLWFAHSLQATELFPFDLQEVAKTAAILRRDGRYNLFFDYYLPFAGRFKKSEAVNKWLSEEPSESANEIRAYAKSIDKAFTAAAKVGAGDKGAQWAGFDKSFKQLQEELQRKPDHPVHRLLKAFYLEEMRKKTPYTQLLKSVQSGRVADASLAVRDASPAAADPSAAQAKTSESLWRPEEAISSPGKVAITGVGAGNGVLEITATGRLVDYKIVTLAQPSRLAIDIDNAVSGFKAKSIPVNRMGLTTVRFEGYPGYLRIFLDAKEGKLLPYRFAETPKGLKIMLTSPE